jgi:hypothetical protein
MMKRQELRENYLIMSFSYSSPSIIRIIKSLVNEYGVDKMWGGRILIAIWWESQKEIGH